MRRWERNGCAVHTELPFRFSVIYNSIYAKYRPHKYTPTAPGFSKVCIGFLVCQLPQNILARYVFHHSNYNFLCGFVQDIFDGYKIYQFMELENKVYIRPTKETRAKLPLSISPLRNEEISKIRCKQTKSVSGSSSFRR